MREFHLSLAFPLLLLHVCSSWAASDSVYDAFLKCLQTNTNQSDQVSNIVYSQTNASYSIVLRNYIRNARFNTSSTSKPLLIVTPTDESHIGAVVICAKSIGTQLKIRSGGHDYEGISYVSDVPFIILDMFNFKSVSVDVDDESVWVQSGATVGELYYRIWEKSKVHAFPAGICPTVGIGGHISGGGYGNLLRNFGLAVDYVLDAQIVDVNGKLLDRKSMGEDLFWAIKGGGGANQNSTTTDIVYKWQQVAPSIDNALFMRMLLQPISSKVTKKTKTVRASIITEYLGTSDQLVALLDKEFPELGLKKEDCMEMSWIDSVLWWANFDNGTSPNAMLDRELDSASFLRRKSDYVQKPISKDGLEWIFKKLIEQGKPGFVFNPYGGKMNEVAASETPFPHRKGNLYKIQYSVNWDEPGVEYERNYTAQVRRLYSYMTPFVSKNPRSAFLNYRDLDIGTSSNGNDSYEKGKIYGLKYFNENFDRLVKVKTAVDPDNFFRNEQSIPTLPSKA
ncbi:hypothetical protein FNV43_RR06491 [Rhamnella rubrinervis]|uniref:FAD-binding PCMH-type domain-containing protein n=1 Tax=Rhamnella rubrinervis TaxID=2594499 RepID=A0A8K0MM12_9ROSA|nr:hypothetical protein FNV43_RR06491 [Rhamnella rubrinervis]